MTNDQTVTQADERLWCLHHIGPDEVHPAPDFATAQKWADWANHRFYDHAEISRFVVALWPWSADRHAEGLAQSIADWTLPPQSSVREEADVLLNTMRGWSDSQFASAATGEYCEDLKAKIEGVLSRILDRLSNERQAECDFSNAVWSALKGDHNDLRRQALILRAYRTAHSGEGRSNGAGEGLAGLEWTEDNLSLRTPYDGDVDGEGRHIVVGGDLIVTFDDSEIADKYRARVIAALSAPQGQVEREADAFLVEWIRDGETWVEAHADEVRAADQARKHGVEYVPLYRAVLAQPEAGGER